jgi:hypothetical protein
MASHAIASPDAATTRYGRSLSPNPVTSAVTRVPPRATKSSASRSTARPGLATKEQLAMKKPCLKIGASAGSSWRSSSAFKTSNGRPRRAMRSRSASLEARPASVS